MRTRSTIYSREPEQVEEERKTKKNTRGHTQAHKHIDKVKCRRTNIQKKRQPKNVEAGEKCAYTGEMDRKEKKHAVRPFSVKGKQK